MQHENDQLIKLIDANVLNQFQYDDEFRDRSEICCSQLFQKMDL